MLNSRIKTKNLIKSQIPEFLFDESPRILEFLQEYYNSSEYQGGPLDILNNIDQYIKLDNIAEINFHTKLDNDVTFNSTEIFVSSTQDFPKENGLIKINGEIISYKYSTSNSFKECTRSFSGITSYRAEVKDQLVFEKSNLAEEHKVGDIVYNLNALFLKEFFKKYKYHFAPGFEGIDFYPSINEKTLLYKLKDFYSTKGSDISFDILFKSIFGIGAKVIKPRDYVVQASDADYRITRDIIAEKISGEPEDLTNLTLYQDEIPGIINSATGTVTNVERIFRNNRIYYKISLDYTEGINDDDFSYHPKTYLTSPTTNDQKYLDVDSTFGFPNSGSIIVYLDKNNPITINYTSKTSNQFLGCTGVVALHRATEIYSPFFAYGYFNDIIIKIRITGVLSDIPNVNGTYFYENNDRIDIVSLGISRQNVLSSSWNVNATPYFEVQTVQQLSGFRYRIITKDTNTIVLGDSVTIADNSGNEYTSLVIKVTDKNSFDIQLNDSINTNLNFVAIKNINKVDTNEYPYLKEISSNVHNVYIDTKNGTDEVYVASPSLPSYLNLPLRFKDFSVKFGGFFDGYEMIIGKHPFFTGDSVTYTNEGENNKLNIPEGTYYVKKINDTTIKLSTSRSNIYTNIFVFVSGEITDNTLQLTKFANQSIRPQGLIRKFVQPIDSSIKTSTNPGQIGMLLNGVELLSYKTGDFINYGPIEKIIVSSEGDSNYDVINPPLLNITDPTGIGATGVCNVTGSLKSIQILENNYSFTNGLPKITISGGNGSGAKAVCKISPTYTEVEFSAYSSSSLVDLSNNIIGFTTFHKFNSFEKVIYSSDNQVAIGGLTNNSVYFVVPLNSTQIKLYPTYESAVSGINTINLTSYSTGIHKFISFNPKNIISSIDVIDGGFGYSTKKLFFEPSDVNIYTDIITIPDHSYVDKEIVTYNSSEILISGLSSTSEYYVKVIDSNKIKLFPIGIGSIASDYYFNNNLCIDLLSIGAGLHELNYQPISVKIESPVGIITFSGQDSSVKIRPIFRGDIKSVSLKSKGINYGDSEIINYRRQPSITVTNGENASLSPIISNGKIVDVLINNSGSGYNSIPDISIVGDGSGASILPVIEDGRIVDVIIRKSGSNYTQNNTFIYAYSAGSGVKFETYIKSWNINLVERLITTSQITSDDGIIYNAINKNYELEYCHAYAPRKFRESVLSSSIGVNGEVIYRDDLSNDTSLIKYHSPIIGWAYDGNPIYGPYGYADPEGGAVKRMQSSYRILNSALRPSQYPVGFFIEDYFYDGDGDLDIYNGRYCKTPEFPDGVYAYFTTINPTEESDGPFRSYLKPAFPYIIGDSYKSNLISFNYNQNSIQEKIDINSTGWLRNTYYYKLLSKNSGYYSTLEPNKLTNESNRIDIAVPGSLTSLKIVSPGKNYQVGDEVIFDNEGSGGSNAFANVSEITGTDIVSIASSEVKIKTVQFIPYSNTGTILGICSITHNLQPNDIITIDNLNNYQLELSNTFSVGILTSKLILTKNIPDQSFTGITTFIDVLGSLNYPLVQVNDIYQIGNEKVKILEIDQSQAKVKILRSYDGTTGLAHSEGSILNEVPRKFTLNVGYTTSINFNLNTDIYFNPKESLGKGTVVGIGTTIFFSHIGYGVTSKLIPTQSIYLKNHSLSTGDLITYSSSGNTPITVSSGTTTYQVSDYSQFYVAKISKDLIGISTVQIGVANTGGFVELGTQNQNVLLSFIDHGTGFNHKFTTNLSNTISGDIKKVSVVVTTSQNHGLSVNDNIRMDIKSGIQTTVVVQYNDTTRRMVFNPKSFGFLNVDVNEDIITIENHGYKTGQKVLHTSQSPTGGLLNDELYYVIVLDENRIRLSKTYYKSLNKVLNLDYVNLVLPASDGALSLVNPSLEAYKNSTVIFDLSDLSLSSSGRPAFSFDFYTDSDFKNKFYTSASDLFTVRKIGKIGVDPNASVSLIIDDNTPQNLYYRLTPIFFDGISLAKQQIITDDFNIVNNNLIRVSNSLYNGIYSISGIGSLSFTYLSKISPEKSSYNSDEAILEYHTSSRTAFGKINRVDVQSGGFGYKKLPNVVKVRSGLGTDSLLLPFSDNIGRVFKYKLNDIGFDYPTDKTLSPSTLLPKIFKIEPLSKFKRISIVSPGVNYYVPPQLVVLDGLTGRVNEEADLRYEIGDYDVSIIRNTTGVYNITPIILPVNNPNGTRIKDIAYNSTTKNVTVGLAVSYGNIDEFPFEVGDEVIIENTNIDIVEGGNGYNSSNYGYKLFTLTEVNPDIGGETPTITYNISDLKNPNPGVFDTFESIGTVTPKKYFPIFEIELIKDRFISGEKIISQSGVEGIAQSYDFKNEYLKINTTEEFKVGDLVTGESTKNRGVISQIVVFETKHNIGGNSILTKGWTNNIGLLGDSLQRLHDNDYYQYFSYSVKSNVSLENWDGIVSDLNHTLGFKKFSDLSVESYAFDPEDRVGLVSAAQQISLSSIATLDSTVDFNLYKDFDIAREKPILIDNRYVSNEILFNSPFLQSYLEFIGNRVLKIDDISSEFNDVNRSFDLYYKNQPIFAVEFNATTGSVVGLTDNTIYLPNHFFVSGEEIEYVPFNNSSANAIGIGTTFFVGVGTTSKLPSSVYVIKIDSRRIQLASSAENALLFNPIPLSLTSVGIGSTHIFKSKNPNTRALITLNGIIQSPLVSTAVTSSTISSVGIGSTIFRLTGISSIFTGDLIKINNEIMFVTSVGVASTNSLSVFRNWVGTTQGIHSGGSLVTKLSGSYNIVDNSVHFSEAVPGLSPIGTTSNGPSEVDYVGLTTSTRFDGRVFIRSALKQGFTSVYEKAYNTNYVFDDISQSFNGITTNFTLKQNKNNITGFSTSNAIILIDDVFQGPQRLGSPLTNINGDYKLTETSGQTIISFTGNPANFNQTNDINASSVPRGGIIVSVGSSSGLRYQPLIGAGGTAIVSAAGTIQSVAIGNSGSGYRVGVQTYIRVGVQTYSSGTPKITYVGYANAANGKITNVVITNPGIGYTRSNPPKVVIDPPLNYTDIPLIYSSSSPSGIGTGATVDITVGQGSSVINFELKNLGYGYGQGDILTVPIGGTTGIPTDASTFTLYAFEEFKVFVDKTFNSKFSGWSVGDILVLDNIEQYFNGRRRLFPLLRNGERISFFPRRSSGIELQDNLLVFINDILQVPGESYTFNGGSTIRFNEAPKPRLSGYTTPGDTCKIMMYTGTQSIDVNEIDVIETLKIGDNVQFFSDVDVTLNQDQRLVVDINAADTVLTNTYAGQGVSDTELLERPINWIKQTEDKIIDEIEVGKDRVYYEPNIHTQCTLLSNVGIGSTFAYVTSVKSLFDNPREGILVSKSRVVEIISNDVLTSGIATATVSIASTISTLNLVNAGSGYTSSPRVTIETPGIGITGIASATANISGGRITSFTITNPGFGYTTGPLAGLVVNQQGIGYPPLDTSNNVFVNARLKTLTGFGRGATATIVINPLNQTVFSTNITNGGTNYKINDLVFLDSYDNVGLATTYRRTTLASPLVFAVTGIKGPNILIAPPIPVIEEVSNVTYEGDYGLIVGVGTTSVGVTTGLVFDFYIPQNSPLVTDGHGITKSGIKTGDYFVVTSSSVGFGVTSLTRGGSTLGIGTENIDNVYEVFSTSQVNRSIPSIGISTVIRVVTRIARYNGINSVVSIASTSNYAAYSWGKINFTDRSTPRSFTVKTNNFAGISTNPIIRRKNPLAYENYL
jgi:hypothetical protein